MKKILIFIFILLKPIYLQSFIESEKIDIFSDSISRFLANKSKSELCYNQNKTCFLFIEKPLGKSIEITNQYQKFNIIFYDPTQDHDIFPKHGVFPILKYIDVEIEENTFSIYLSMFSFDVTHKNLNYNESYKISYMFNKNINEFEYAKTEVIQRISE